MTLALTEHVLIFVGILALLASIGVFIEFDDKVTRLILLVLSTIVWGMFGMSAFNVLVDPATGTVEPMESVAYLGIGLAAVMGVLTLYELLFFFYDETVSTDPEEMFP